MLLKYNAALPVVAENYVGLHWPTDVNSVPYVNINPASAITAAASGVSRTNHRLLSAAGSVNSTLVKTGATTLFRISGSNANAAVRFLKLYNKASAPTVGTDVPIFTFKLLASADFLFEMPVGHLFPLGLGYGFTTAAADADTGALTAADIICLNVSYS